MALRLLVFAECDLPQHLFLGAKRVVVGHLLPKPLPFRLGPCLQVAVIVITIARLTTRRHCAACDPHSLPYRQSRVCPNRAKRHRAVVCTRGPGKHYNPHCAARCAQITARDNVAQRQRRGTVNNRQPEARTTSLIQRNRPIAVGARAGGRECLFDSMQLPPHS